MIDQRESRLVKISIEMSLVREWEARSGVSAPQSRRGPQTTGSSRTLKSGTLAASTLTETATQPHRFAGKRRDQDTTPRQEPCLLEAVISPKIVVLFPIPAFWCEVNKSFVLPTKGDRVSPR